jgi:hypothetical protein
MPSIEVPLNLVSASEQDPPECTTSGTNQRATVPRRKPAPAAEFQVSMDATTARLRAAVPNRYPRMMHHRRFSLALAPMALLAVVGCNDHPLKPICYGHWSEDTTQVSLDSRRKVDILFVIDDSGSMGEEQGALAANFSALVEQLESIEVGADYRIGITTTDNTACLDDDAELGALRLRSCLSHIDDFVLDVDRRDEACRSWCPAELESLAPLPTALEDGGALAPRPWLERSDLATNVPEGVTTEQALACWGPQGLTGCGYEAPLEAVLAAFARSEDDDDPAAGFLRDDALLQVVIVTDEVDCSIAPAGEAAFDPDGTRTLWNGYEGPWAPSAACWRAGTACQSLPDGRTECAPADIDSEGRPAAAEDAVLFPVSRYVDALRELDERKREHMGTDDAQVLLSVIAGVPQGWDGAPIDYGPGDDPDFFEKFGVGAGCRSDMGEAVPPARILSVASELGEANVFSICDGDYRPALAAIGGRLVEQLSRPTCIEPGRELIGDDAIDGCWVQRRVGDEILSVPTCERTADGWALGAQQTLCSYVVTDEVHPSCAAEGSDIELRYLYTQGIEFGEVEVTCAVETGGECRPGAE